MALGVSQAFIFGLKKMSWMEMGVMGGVGLASFFWDTTFKTTIYKYSALLEKYKLSNKSFVFDVVVRVTDVFAGGCVLVNDRRLPHTYIRETGP
jgi:hypothetical protein